MSSPYYLYGLSKYLGNIPQAKETLFLQNLSRKYYRQAIAASDSYTRASFETQSLKLEGFALRGREVFEKEGCFYESLLLQYGGYLARLQAVLAKSKHPSLVFVDLETNDYGEIRELAFFHTRSTQIDLYARSKRPRSLALKQGIEALKILALTNPYWVGHNIREHDLPILKNYGLRDERIIDTLELSAIAYPLWPDLRLKCPHRADEDVYQNIRLFISLIFRLQAKSKTIRDQIQLPVTLWSIFSQSAAPELKGANRELASLYKLRAEELIRPGYEINAIHLREGNNVILKRRLPYCFIHSQTEEDVAVVSPSEHILKEPGESSGLAGAFIRSFFDECRQKKIPCSRYLLHPFASRKWGKQLLTSQQQHAAKPEQRIRVYFMEELPFLNLTNSLQWPDRNFFYLAKLSWSSDSAEWPVWLKKLPLDEVRRQKKRRINFLLHRHSLNWLRLAEDEVARAPDKRPDFLKGFFLFHALTGEIRFYPHLEYFPLPKEPPPSRLIKIIPKEQKFLVSPDSPYAHTFYAFVLLGLLQQLREGRRVIFLYDTDKSRDPWPEIIRFLKDRSIRLNMARPAESKRRRASRNGIFRNLELLFQGRQQACFFPLTALAEVLEAFTFWQKAYPEPILHHQMILLLESLPLRWALGYHLFASMENDPSVSGQLEEKRDLNSLELIFKKFRSFYLNLFVGLDSVYFFDYRIPDIETSFWPLATDDPVADDLKAKLNQLLNPKAWEEKDKTCRDKDIELLLRNVFFREEQFSWQQYEKTQKRNIEEFFKKDQRHRLITLPTGGGKSLIFQLPAIIKTAYSGRLVLIISPLKALIQEQSFKLCSLGMFDFVAGFHQDLDREEVRLYYQQIQDGTLRIVYVTPERFRSTAFRKALQRRLALDGGLEFAVFDEVHCVADWGYHFRPDYLCCYQDLLCHELYGRVQGFLFSATITQTNLNLLIEKIPASSVAKIKDVNPQHRVPLRPEIEKRVFPLVKEEKQDADIPEMPNEKISAIKKILEEDLDAERFRAIIFYQSQTGTEELAESLNEMKLKDKQGKTLHFDCFHAGIPVEEREMIYRGFSSGEIQVLVATRAFGLGMDIQNISLVIHYQRPETLEDYLQEIGRAARRRKGTARGYVLLTPEEMAGEVQDGRLDADLTKEAVLNIRSELTDKVFKKESLQEAIFSMQFHGLEFQFDEHLSGVSKFSSATHKKRKEAIVRSALYWLSQYESRAFDWGEYRLYGLEIDLLAKPSDLPGSRAWQRQLRKDGRGVFSFQKLISQYNADERGCYLDLLKYQRQGLIIISHRSIKPTSFVLPARSESALDDGRDRPGVSLFPLFSPLRLCLSLFKIIRQRYLARKQFISWQDLVAQISSLIREYRPEQKLFFSEEQKNRIWGQESEELTKLQQKGFWQKLPNPRQDDEGIIYGLDCPDHLKDYPCLAEWIEKQRRKMLHDLVKKSRRIGHLFRFWQKHKIVVYRTENPVEKKCLIYRLLEVNNNFDVSLAEQIYKYLTDNTPGSFGILSVYERFHQDHSLDEMKQALGLLKLMGYIHYFEQEEEIGYRLVRRPPDQWREEVLDRIKQINHLGQVKEFLTRIFFAVLASGDQKLTDQLISDYFIRIHSATSPGFSERTNTLWQQPAHAPLRRRIKKYFSGEKKKAYLEARNRELDDEQKEMVEAFSRGESLLVTAGPGAGKTRTLIYAVLDLLIQKSVSPEHILLLSYTHKAVWELQKRIRTYQPQFDLLNDWKRLNIYTFHGFARKVLGAAEIGSIRQEIKGHHEYLDLFHRTCLERAAELFSATHYHYLLIDEFQDVLAEKLEFVKKIITKSHQENLKIFLVGDPLQDIFHYQQPAQVKTSFDLISAFLPGQSEKELVKNYRSAPELCRFFDEYVKENYALNRVHYPARAECQSWLLEGKKVVIASPQQDAVYRQIAEDVAWCINKATSQPLSLAILGRNNQQVEEAFYNLSRKLSPRCLPLNEKFPLWRRWDIFKAIRDLSREEQDGRKINEATIKETFDRYQNLGLIPAYIASYQDWEPLAIRAYLSDRQKTFSDLQLGPNPAEKACWWKPVTSRDLEDYLIKEAGANQPRVIFSTVHKIKGLEFDVVYLLPFTSKRETLEEKNIGYVGITRARHRVTRYVYSSGHLPGRLPVVISFPCLISCEFGLRFDTLPKPGRLRVDTLVEVNHSGEIFLTESPIAIGKVNPQYLREQGNLSPWKYRVRELYVRFYREEDPAYWRGHTEFLKDRVDRGAYFLLPVLEKVKEERK